MATNRMRPIHPCEILREEFLAPLGMSANALARHCRYPPRASTTSCLSGVPSRPTRHCG